MYNKQIKCVMYKHKHNINKNLYKSVIYFRIKFNNLKQNLYN